VPIQSSATTAVKSQGSSVTFINRQPSVCSSAPALSEAARLTRKTERSFAAWAFDLSAGR
jgi:hypothetical protein